jgi:hypothetical protein
LPCTTMRKVSPLPLSIPPKTQCPRTLCPQLHSRTGFHQFPLLSNPSKLKLAEWEMGKGPSKRKAHGMRLVLVLWH